MYLLDINVLTELREGKSKPHQAVLDWAASVPSSVQFVSPIVLMEIEMGVLRLERRAHSDGQALRPWLGRVRTLFADRTLPIDDSIGQRCAKLHVPDPASPHDALIAATALVHGMTLVTRNTADFAATEVGLLNPWERSDSR